jgi:hypothetical protein
MGCEREAKDELLSLYSLASHFQAWQRRHAPGAFVACSLLCPQPFAFLFVVFLLAYEEGDCGTELPSNVVCQVGAWLMVVD